MRKLVSSDAQNKLYGIKIWDSTGNYFYTEVDVNQSIQHNRPTESQVVYNSKYPYHIHNGKANYFSGTCSGNFSENQGECDTDYNFDYRIDGQGNVIYNTIYVATFVKWLHNDRIKHLQLAENFIIPVGILGEVQWDVEHSIEDGETTKVTFNWEQLDDEYSLIGGVKYCGACGNLIMPPAHYCPICGRPV